MESIDSLELQIMNSQDFEIQDEIKRQKFQIVNQVGMIYTTGTAFLFQSSQIFNIIVGKFFHNFSKTTISDSVLLCTLIVNQIFGTLSMFLLTKFITKIEIKKRAYGCKKYFANLLINSGLLIFCLIIGYAIEYSLFNKNYSENHIKTIVNDPNIFLKYIVICLIGPITEELIFRKFLVDRLAIYSKTLAIFSSGIMFGIVQRNLAQFFGATFSGWALAYAYAETGNILIPISYHIIENSFSTILSIEFPKDNPIITKIYVIMALLRFIEVLIGIIILIVMRRKIKVTGEDNRSSDKWKFFKSYGMWIFVLEGCILFSLNYMN